MTDPQPNSKKQECPSCGNETPQQLKACPQCGSLKCENCDMGDDVECPSCPDDE
jgi:transcription elongation factor Elf1